MRVVPVLATVWFAAACLDEEPANGPDAGDDEGDSDGGADVETLAELRSCPTLIALDDELVYLASPYDTAVLRVPKTGGVPDVVGTSAIGDLAADGDAAYVATWSGVSRIGHDAWAAETFAAAPRIDGMDVEVTQVAARGGSVYFSIDVSCVDGPCGGLNPVLVALSADGPGTGAFLSVPGGGNVFDLAAGATTAYFTGNLMGVPGQLHSAPLAGGPLVNYAEYAEGPVAAGPEDGFVVFGTNILRVPADGGPTQMLVADANAIAGVAADAASVYWISGGDPGTLSARDVDAGAVRIIASGLSWPAGIAVDDTFAYWIECASNRSQQAPARGWIRRVTK